MPLRRAHLRSARRGSGALQQLLARVGDKPQDRDSLEDFSFWAATLCTFSDGDRSRMMTMTDTKERLKHAKDSLTVGKAHETMRLLP